jgi:hypothetical protein
LSGKTTFHVSWLSIQLAAWNDYTEAFPMIQSLQPNISERFSLEGQA